MKVCPECGGEFEDGEFCPNDAARLRDESDREDGEKTDPLVGRLIDDRWRIQRKFSEGGMGSIYLASQKSVDRQVAIKTLRPQLSDNDEFTERFFREARVTTTINHPHCVTIHDFGQTENGTLYLVMEYLEGEPLADRMQRGAMELLETLTIGKQIASALSAAHERDIVHRDLKPDNVFLLEISDGSTFCKVLDFGISKDLSEEQDLTKTGELFGTPRYMSPEQSEGRELDGRTDLYSLGCILYEMLTGRPPFVGDTAMAILVAHVQEDVPSIDEVAPREVPPQAADYVMAMLEKDPADRPLSAAEVGSKLEEILPTVSTGGRTWDSSLESASGGAAGAAGTGGQTAPADGGSADISTADTLGEGVVENTPVDGANRQTSGTPNPGTGAQSGIQRNRGLLVSVVVLLSLGFIGLTGIGGYYVYATWTAEEDAPGPMARWFGGGDDQSDGSAARYGNAGESSGDVDGSVGEQVSGVAGGGQSDDEDGHGASAESTGGDGREEPTAEESTDTSASNESSDSDQGDRPAGSESGSESGSATAEEDESGGRPDDRAGDQEETSDEDEKSVREKIAGITGTGDDDGSGGPESDEETSDGTGDGEPAAGGESSESTGSDEPRINPETLVERTSLSAAGRLCNKSDIERTLTVVEPSLGQCYHDRAASDPSLGGSLMLDWKIATDGSTLEASVIKGSLSDGTVRDCVLRTIKKLTFAAPDGGRCYTRVTFDFRK